MIFMLLHFGAPAPRTVCGQSLEEAGTKLKDFQLVLSAASPKLCLKGYGEGQSLATASACLGSSAASYNFLKGAYSIELRAEKPGKLLSELKDKVGHKSCFQGRGILD